MLHHSSEMCGLTAVRRCSVARVQPLNRGRLSSGACSLLPTLQHLGFPHSILDTLQVHFSRFSERSAARPLATKIVWPAS